MTKTRSKEGKLSHSNSTNLTLGTKGSVATVTASGNIKVIRELKCPKGSTAVAYTDDLNILAAGQEDGSVLLFNEKSESRTMIDYEMILQGEPCTVLKIKSSPKGGYNKTLLAGYLSGHIKLWDTTIGKALFTLKENRQLYGLSYHPRSHRFISVGNDFKVNIYDEETRVTERVLASSGIKGCKNGHMDSVCTAVFHPKNPFELISGGVDNTIQFWDIRAPYAIRNIEGVSMYGDALDITEDGKVILSGNSGTFNNPIQVYDYDSGALLKSYPRIGGYVYCCKFLTPKFVCAGSFYQHAFKLIDMKASQTYGQISGLPGCVMGIAVQRKVPRFKTILQTIPNMAVSTADKLLEFEIYSPTEVFEAPDFYY